MTRRKTTTKVEEPKVDKEVTEMSEDGTTGSINFEKLTEQVNPAREGYKEMKIGDSTILVKM